MDSLDTNPQLTVEFVKFLNAQLQECRDQLQRSTEENASLTQDLQSALQHSDASSTGRADDTQTVSRLEAEMTALKDELAAAQCTAEANRNDAAMWRERYEKAKTSISTEDLGDLQRRAAVEKVMRAMKEDLALGPVDTPSTAQKKFEEFSTFMSKLSASAIADTHTPESRVVFEKPKLQILPKAAIAASDGGFAFFGGLLQRCTPPSQNALLICPTHQYTPYSAMTESTDPSWSKTTLWSSLAGQRREIFDTNGERLAYAGTFLVHAGPKVLRLEDLPQPVNETLIRELASRTFDPASKSQKTKAKAYLQALAELYKEGAITVQVLGLQRVGFNEKFFAILRKAYGKRSKASVGRARSETQRSISPVDWDGKGVVAGTSAKRGREEEPEAGPSKVRRSDKGWSDGWLLVI